MKFENITPSTFATYAIPLANAASKIPGCKVKPHHLLEAAAHVEGYENWDTLCGMKKQSPEFEDFPIFTSRNILGLVAYSDRVEVYDVCCDYDIKGFSNSDFLRIERESVDIDGKRRNDPKSYRVGLLDASVEEGFDAKNAFYNLNGAIDHLESVLDCLRSGNLPSVDILNGWTVYVYYADKGEVPHKSVLTQLKSYKDIINAEESNNYLLSLIRDGAEPLDDSIIDYLKEKTVISKSIPYGVHTASTLPYAYSNNRISMLPKQLRNSMERAGFKCVLTHSLTYLWIRISNTGENAIGRLPFLLNENGSVTTVQTVDSHGIYCCWTPSTGEAEAYVSPWEDLSAWSTMMEVLNGVKVPGSLKGADNEMLPYVASEGVLEEIVKNDERLAGKILSLMKVVDGALTINGVVKLLSPTYQVQSVKTSNLYERILRLVHNNELFTFCDTVGARNVIIKRH